MIKFLFKWLLRLFIAAVVIAVLAIVTLLLSYNSILRVTMERQIRAQTGMDAEIGSLHFALTSPTIKIQNFKLYNSANFGGAPFLDIPEIYIEYDRAALKRKEVHITLMRFNLGELDIVKNQAGLTNIFALGISAPKTPAASHGTINFKKQTGFEFNQIDVLNVSIGEVKFIDLKNPQNDREQNIGLENVVVPNVKSQADIGGLEALIVLRGNGFFESLVDQKKPGLELLKQLGL
jgi:uncharacterized protein involved in outer membrane biogenesis